jgi:hypothetical protein
MSTNDLLNRVTESRSASAASGFEGGLHRTTANAHTDHAKREPRKHRSTLIPFGNVARRGPDPE